MLWALLECGGCWGAAPAPELCVQRNPRDAAIDPKGLVTGPSHPVGRGAGGPASPKPDKPAGI